MSTHDTHTQYKLRMPPELRDKLKSASEENHRSMNAEIVARLLESFEPTEASEFKLSEETRRELMASFLAEMIEEKISRQIEERERNKEQ